VTSLSGERQNVAQVCSNHSLGGIGANIDITFDFRRDTPEGKDPDTYSKTLRRYHKLLWSKRLPCGTFFGLEDAFARHYLHHQSNLGEFSLSSDAVIPTFRWHKRIQTLVPADELKAFRAAGYTIGGMMVFPGNRIDGKWTINQARGCTRRIGDRFDLTLECIRRHYRGEPSPLSEVLGRYARFFDLFVNFRGYVEFFLLQDLVSADLSVVKIAAPFDDFNGSPIPNDLDEYKAYESAARSFIGARNQRILSAS
jgi:hypothetical protein